MASSIFLIVLLLVAVLGSISAATTAYAQGGLGSPTPLSGKSLDVLVEPTWSNDGQAKFKVSFLKPGTDTVQIHIDYGFVIKQGDKEIFNAAQQGQPLLHTAEGVVTIPYTFTSNGDYSIEVSVAGINFVPMNTETATFSVNVTPEFPVGVVGAAMAALVGTTVILSRKFNVAFKI
jgi:hypothetical protein